ncbi:hypothetical protein PPL_03573 [Heterostelium album PN500]|uniref:Fungal lipase-type domain-containing protein n=1 Tax=Heterostelium pallidum (strain ATCC 26659 / Pp 5 / PN500) TaxID=670386 RepID=D3B562_HETP5|nr:hypothetical protein PPL_03573 [Heterostelium album PN500]EFA83427.1 hypothetical protein PPL_03573 [Heterostelium album PN500]|eukprot:XP_020435544.1 hypothetical protein PPL_03573 [Heterostelium album PN500]
MKPASLLLLLIFAYVSILVRGNEPPQNPYSSQYGIDNVLMNYVAYCDAEQIIDWSCYRCQNFPHATNAKVIQNNETSTRGIITTYNNTVYVAFRGSVSTTDWIENFEFFHVDYPNVTDAKVHYGFYHSWLSVSEEIYAGIVDSLKQCPDCNKITVLGHSYGAAVSTFCTVSVVNWFPNINVYSMTIGSPRVGNDVFAQYYNSIHRNNWRIVNQQDPVPHLPPEYTIYEYHHVPNEVWYPNNVTTYRICNDSGEDKSCSDSVDPLKYNTSDHLDYLGQRCCC